MTGLVSPTRLALFCGGRAMYRSARCTMRSAPGKSALFYQMLTFMCIMMALHWLVAFPGNESSRMSLFLQGCCSIVWNRSTHSLQMDEDGKRAPATGCAGKICFTWEPERPQKEHVCVGSGDASAART